MQELVGGKNTIGRTAAVLKKPHKATFTFTFTFFVVFLWFLICGLVQVLFLSSVVNF